MRVYTLLTVFRGVGACKYQLEESVSRSQSISSLFRDMPCVRETVSHGRRSAVSCRLTLKDAQRLVRLFAERNGWEDVPNVDKFDHLHEELIEMSRHLRYKDRLERIEFVNSNKDIFVDGIGDLL